MRFQGQLGYNRRMKVRVTMDVAGRHVDETIAGEDATSIIGQAKARVAQELGPLGLFLQYMSPLTFAQEAVRRYNAASGTSYSIPVSAEEFLKLGQDLGYVTTLPEY